MDHRLPGRHRGDRRAQSHRVRATTRIGKLQEERDRLREAQADLQSRIAALKSRPVLGPKAAALGLHTPSDSESVSLRVERAR
ncbi:MAG: hypothetical protein IPJ11_09980 [Gemmatimonadetes bacterium]|nr:hypothetical protein [Gemmatimonadota bacterium]